MRKPNDLTDEIKVLPVVVIHSAGETEPTLEALRDGGIPAAAGCLKHSMEGDMNPATVAEIEALANGNATGRVQR